MAMTMTMSMSTACDCWAPAALSQSGGAGCGLLFAACCAYDRLGQVLLSLAGFLFFLCCCLGQDAKQGLLQLHKLSVGSSVAAAVATFFAHRSGDVSVFIYVYVCIYLRTLAGTYARRWPLSAGLLLFRRLGFLSLRRCVCKCLFTCLFRLTH